MYYYLGRRPVIIHNFIEESSNSGAYWLDDQNIIDRDAHYFLDLETWAVEIILDEEKNMDKVNGLLGQVVRVNSFSELTPPTTSGTYFIGTESDPTGCFCRYMDFRTGKITDVWNKAPQPKCSGDAMALGVRQLSNDEKIARKRKPHQIPYEKLKMPVIIKKYYERHEIKEYFAMKEDLKKEISEMAKRFIENNNDLEQEFDLTSKKDIFLLGLAFAAKRKILKVNLDKLNLDTSKSFDKMLYTWWKNDLKPSFDENNSKDYAFLIYPFRQAGKILTESANAIIYDHIEKRGYKTYPLVRDMFQEDYYSYKVSLYNANAISNSKKIFLFYDRDSIDSIFDLGVAYYFQMKYPERTFSVVESGRSDFSSGAFVDKIISSMLDMQQEYNNKKNNILVRKK